MAGSDDKSEALDDDVVGDLEYPPEQPMGVHERLTPVVEQEGESFGHRVAREMPDDFDPDDDPLAVGTLYAPGGDMGIDDEADEVAFEARRTDSTSWDVAQELGEVIPAEEAAMHLTDPPPMDDTDGYVEY